MRRIVHFCACLALVSVAGTLPAAAQRKETNRIREAATVLREVLAMPDGVPRNLLDRAECVLDNDANERIYGREVTPQEIVSGSLEVLARAKTLIDLLNSRSPTNLSNRPDSQ